MKEYRFLIAIILGLFVLIRPVFGQGNNLLTSEERLWLTSRNNTIVVYPEQNNAPYSYQSAAGTPQGLAIDYLSLIAENVGAKLVYLTARSRTQILEDSKLSKGDVIATLSPDSDREAYLFFTEPYITVPAMIVVRKDSDSRTGLTLNDFNGKKVAVIADSALEKYIRTNYPRVVIETVTDDEVSLQQTVLGEVDAGAIDVASLSYYLSKQVLSSVKIVGTTGFQYNPSFAVPKDKEILQSILSKGLSQISTSDRAVLTEKWIVVPGEQHQSTSWFNRIQTTMGFVSLYLVCIVGIGVIVALIIRRRHAPFRYFRKRRALDELKDEVIELEYANKELVTELEHIKTMEEDIKNKIKEIE